MCFKRFLCLMVFVSILLSQMVFSSNVKAFVYRPPVPIPDLKLSSETCSKNEIVSLDLSIGDVPTTGLYSFIITLEYNTSKLKFMGFEAGPIITNKTSDISYNITQAGMKIMYSDADQTGTSHITKSGIMATMKFQALGDNETVNMDLFFKQPGSLGKTSLVCSSSVKILDNLELYCDVNNDKVIDSLDYSLFRKYILGKLIPDSTDITFKKRLDANGDGLIDTADYTLLRRYILEMITEFPVGIKFERGIT